MSWAAIVAAVVGAASAARPKAPPLPEHPAPLQIRNFDRPPTWCAYCRRAWDTHRHDNCPSCGAPEGKA